MHLTNALITSLALAGSSTAYFSIPLGNAPAPAAAASAAAQPVSVYWTPFGRLLFQPSRYRVVWVCRCPYYQLPLTATAIPPHPCKQQWACTSWHASSSRWYVLIVLCIYNLLISVACPASCVAQAATVTVTSPPVTTTTTATTTTTLSGPLPTEVADGYANCAGQNPPKPNPLFDTNGDWACCVGSYSGGTGVGCN